MRVRIRKKKDRAVFTLYYRDSVAGRDVTKSSTATTRREAERQAVIWEQELAKGVEDVSWEQFRDRFEMEHLQGRSPKTAASYGTALNIFEQLVGKPRRLKDVTTSTMSKFASLLRSRKNGSSAVKNKSHKRILISKETVETYVRHVRSALSWAAKLDLIERAPKILHQRTGKRRFMRGRAITTEEYERILEVAKDFETDDMPWSFFLQGLWFSGLRLGEMQTLSWDSPPLRVSLDQRRPKIVAYFEGQKSRQDESMPITPDFAELLQTVPVERRRGRVFRMPRRVRDITDELGAIVAKANVIVNDSGKLASSHDFRRAFGTRWALKLHPVVLQRLMRHKDISTTMRYYIDLDSDKISDAIWEAISVTTFVTVSENEPEKPKLK